MDNKLKKFSDELLKKAGNNLVSLIVYGSVATGEYYKKSDYNTLIALNEIGLNELNAISALIKKWVSQGNAVPMIFTKETIKMSIDVFPLEFIDIKENHIVIYGEDLFKNMKINTKNLRLEVEKELKGIFLKLTRAYLMTEGKKNELKKLMLNSISGVISLFKGVLRVYKIKVPVKKYDVINAMPQSIKLNKTIFFDILKLKDDVQIFNDDEITSIFSEYVENIEKVIKNIDKKGA
ncbi:MAG: nucleotidyltransferase domain-containing protein [Candidatus Goldbacteria bacterium]|nr:nucleotidyltransferase domain-containing protein [Candidatus Goldiibacteriota bacterium]